MKKRELRKELLSYIAQSIDMLCLEEHFDNLSDQELDYMEYQKDLVVERLIKTYKF